MTQKIPWTVASLLSIVLFVVHGLAAWNADGRRRAIGRDMRSTRLTARLAGSSAVGQAEPW